MNFTNPVPRICTAANLYSSIKTIGICHQINFGYFILAALFADELDLRLPRDFNFRWNDRLMSLFQVMSKKAREKFIIRAWGLNHFTWMINVTEKGTGRGSSIPKLKEEWKLFLPLSSL